MKAAEERRGGTRRMFVAAMVVLTAIMLALPAAALALPREIPDDTPMIEGRVRAIEQVGNKVWLGGLFDTVQNKDGGTVNSNAGNLAVFNAQMDTYLNIAPNLGGAGTEVWDIEKYGGTNNLLIAGKFTGPSAVEKNLVLVDGTNGNVIRWYNSESLKSVLPAPDLGRVYGGGRSLTAFDFATGNRLWTGAKTSIDPDIRDKPTAAGYRDLVLDGPNIWAACACDSVAGNPSKALVKLDADDGTHDPNWVAEAGVGAVGQALVFRDGKLYLGAGGSDFIAQYGRNNNGDRGWIRDTSGSVQALEAMGDQLIVGGHFFYVGDGPGDRCGKGRPGDGQLDPFGECQRRQGIAAYSFDGALDTNWNPKYQGSYSLVWALHVEGTRLHTGGEFSTVSGFLQRSYARFS